MPLYDLACHDCDRVEERFIPLAEWAFELPRCECGGLRYRKITPLHVISDIEPYQAMGTDVATGTAPMITSRSQHREYLKRNNFIELGNDIKPPERREELTDTAIGRDIKKTIEQKGIRL